MTREEIERAQSLLEMPKWLSCTATPIYDSRRDELRSILWTHRRALLCSAEDALRYREVVALAGSIASELYHRFRSRLPEETAKDCQRLAEMAREALAPKEEA